MSQKELKTVGQLTQPYRDSKDLDKLKIQKLEDENLTLQEELRAYKEQEHTVHDHEKHLQEEISSLKNVVLNLQDTITKLGLLKGENRALKNDLQKLSVEKDKEILHHEKQLKMLYEKQNQLETEKDQEIKEIHRTAEEKVRVEKNLHTKELETKQMEVTNLNKEIEDVKKRMKSEITKLQVEYEGKVNHLQDQIVKTANQSNSNQLGNGSEIFRKKLQFLKMQHEKEVRRMKQQIQELQNKLQKAEDKTFDTVRDYQPQNSNSTIRKKVSEETRNSKMTRETANTNATEPSKQTSLLNRNPVVITPEKSITINTRSGKNSELTNSNSSDKLQVRKRKLFHNDRVFLDPSD
ncbi:rho GTPase-activating protein gacN-like isoform X2 [Limulus polyphemus]|uniref:Rho GTPase-activating protein gacN-like isoform X2 n=1 Tax=Limulus polyphemus TaxID=6850 RepID=A0ABM1TN99_LIMPO|nr:rho GTPase-activating protein gacN-like isoform X2 [Limulus polyphemus]